MKLSLSELINNGMFIKSVQITDHRKDVGNLIVYSGTIFVGLVGIEDHYFSFEWSAYHRDSPHHFLKSDRKWFTLYGDWHIGYINKTTKLYSYSLYDEYGPIESDIAEMCSLNIFIQEYAWKNNVRFVIENLSDQKLKK